MVATEPVRVFISYKKDDSIGDGNGRAFVKILKQKIEDAARALGTTPLDVWYDENIESGTKWGREITHHLNTAEVIILVYTPEFFAPNGYISKIELPTVLTRLDELQIVQIVRRPVTEGESFFTTSSIPKRLRERDPEHDGHPFDGISQEETEVRLSETADNIIAAATRAYAARQATQVRPTLENYVDKINMRISRPDRANPEDQLKTPIQNCLDAVGPLLSRRPLSTRTEDPQLPDHPVSNVRLDVAIIDERTGYRVGHVELKAPNKGANPTKLRGQGNWTKHDKEQWSKLKEHPNLLYCNGLEWTLIRKGIQLDHIDLEDYIQTRISDEGVRRFTELIGNFVSWRPTAPRTARALAKRLAPLARILREAVAHEMTKAENSHDPSRSQLVQLHRTWRHTLLPDATEQDFADSVAQTFTYALLLARLNDKISLPLDSDDVAKSLRVHGHRLLGSVLDLLADTEVRKPLNEQIGLIETAIAAVEPSKLASRMDTWLYFYEDFLAEYDSKRRKDAGVYYTPVSVVGAQVRLTDFALRSRLQKATGFGDPEVKVLDPATGTGTYLLSIVETVLLSVENQAHQTATQLGLDELMTSENTKQHLKQAAESLNRRLFGFELLIGAYSVAHLRLSKELSDAGADLGKTGVGVYLTDTLTAPREGHGTLDQPPLFWGATQRAIVAEQQESDAVKSEREIVTVILGNPPYNRTNKKAGQGAGGSETSNMVLSSTEDRQPLLDDFRNPVVASGNGRSLKHNLNDPYIYFLRWAIWKACEQDPTAPSIVSFITNSSYLRGVPFSGVREHMRRHFDEIWIIDLGGGGRGARREDNVFSIQTPVAIFVGVQLATPKNRASDTLNQRAYGAKLQSPAVVWYRRITGTRNEKLAQLDALSELDSRDSWTQVNDETLTDLSARFIPAGKSDFWGWPTLDALMPWAHSGAQFTRTWPIAPSADTLRERWDDLFITGAADSTKFREGRDRKISTKKADLMTGASLPKLSEDGAVRSILTPVRYGFRSFDRMWCFPDSRLGDYLRPPLWQIHSRQQVYLTSLHATPLGAGPAVTLSSEVPDLHYFRGSYGTRDIFPLWRNSMATEGNVNHALLEILSHTYEGPVSPEDLLAYIVGLLGTGAYAERFYDDLGESPARVPITKSRQLFREVALLGSHIIAIETYGERYTQFDSREMHRSAVIVRSPGLGDYPENFEYDSKTQTLTVGHGLVSGVAPEVWKFEVSGLQVVSSWLGYRMPTKKGIGGPLDEIQPTVWSFDDELIQVLHAVENVVKASETSTKLLDEVVGGDLFSAEDIPAPTSNEQSVPVPVSDDQSLRTIWAAGDDAP